MVFRISFLNSISEFAGNSSSFVSDRGWLWAQENHHGRLRSTTEESRFGLRLPQGIETRKPESRRLLRFSHRLGHVSTLEAPIFAIDVKFLWHQASLSVLRWGSLMVMAPLAMKWPTLCRAYCLGSFWNLKVFSKTIWKGLWRRHSQQHSRNAPWHQSTVAWCWFHRTWSNYTIFMIIIFMSNHNIIVAL